MNLPNTPSPDSKGANLAECADCGLDEWSCTCDDDFSEDFDCTWCGGEGEFWGNELPGYDPGWHLPDRLYPCPACKGTGNRRDQVLF